MAERLRELAPIVVWLVLMLAGGRLQGANSSDDKAFNVVNSAFSQYQAWDRAEAEAANFIKNYPASKHYGDAVLIEAQALFKQQKYPAMIDLLSALQMQTNLLADQFTYWMAQAYFYQGNYPVAATNFARLVKDYPASTRRLQAAVGEADARAKLGDWAGVVAALRPPEGAFQQMAKTNLTDPEAVRGIFVLTEAALAQKDFAGAEHSLQSLAAQKLGPEQEWGRQYLQCRILAGQDPEKARQKSADLVALSAGRPELQAEAVLLQGAILEQLDRLPEAIQTYETNLDGDLPIWRKQQALLKIVTLDLRLNQAAEAARKLEDFLAKHPEQKGSDLELLALGELHLKEALEPGAATNALPQAQAAFEKLINTFTNSDLLGKAQLDLGWCLWTEGKIPESEAAFSNAVERLPELSTNQSGASVTKLTDALLQPKNFAAAMTNQSRASGSYEDKAVAIFKWADAQYRQKQYAAAVTNYTRVIDQYGSLTAIKNELAEQALYQIVRASVAQTNLPTAAGAMRRILEWFPNGLLGAPSMLLVGQALNRDGGPAEARKVFSDFIARFPATEPLVPEVKLAMARTYEKESNWPAAIEQYKAWVAIYTNSPALPRAEFSRAWATYRSGDETNALPLFTNFVARFQTNEIAARDDLAASAQYWVGDYYWRQENFRDAESSYQKVYLKWQASKLRYQAYMMAGRVAMERASPVEAVGYFTNLTASLSVSNSDCPKELALQAWFAEGDASMALPSETYSNKYRDAALIFSGIANGYTNDPIAPLAWGRLGDCYRNLAATDPAQYEPAIESYQKVIDSDLADAAVRSMAECGIGQALEGRGRLEPPGRRSELLRQAVDHYLNVLLGSDLRDNEEADAFWIKEAGLAAARVDEDLGEWDQAVSVYESLNEQLPPLPQLQSYLEKKIAYAKAQKQKLAPEGH